MARCRMQEGWGLVAGSGRVTSDGSSVRVRSSSERQVEEEARDVLGSGSKTTREIQQDCWVESSPREVFECRYPVTYSASRFSPARVNYSGQAWGRRMVD